MAFKRVLMHLRIRKLHQSCICFVFLSLFFVSGQRAAYCHLSLDSRAVIALPTPYCALCAKSNPKEKSPFDSSSCHIQVSLIPTHTE